MNQKRGKVATGLLFLAFFVPEGARGARWGIEGGRGEKAREGLKRGEYGTCWGRDDLNVGVLGCFCLVCCRSWARGMVCGGWMAGRRSKGRLKGV